jgi:hypothetical protein
VTWHWLWASGVDFDFLALGDVALADVTLSDVALVVGFRGGLRFPCAW